MAARRPDAGRGRDVPFNALASVQSSQTACDSIETPPALSTKVGRSSDETGGCSIQRIIRREPARSRASTLPYSAWSAIPPARRRAGGINRDDVGYRCLHRMRRSGKTGLPFRWAAASMCSSPTRSGLGPPWIFWIFRRSPTCSSAIQRPHPSAGLPKLLANPAEVPGGCAFLRLRQQHPDGPPRPHSPEDRGRAGEEVDRLTGPQGHLRRGSLCCPCGCYHRATVTQLPTA